MRSLVSLFCRAGRFVRRRQPLILPPLLPYTGIHRSSIPPPPNHFPNFRNFAKQPKRPSYSKPLEVKASEVAFPCHHCHEVFEDPDSLKDHIKEKHPQFYNDHNLTFECDCGNIFYKEEIEYHNQWCTKPSDYENLGGDLLIDKYRKRKKHIENKLTLIGTKRKFNRDVPRVIEDGGDRSPRVVVAEPGGSTVEVLLNGAQVVSWKNEKGEEMLFVTDKALWKKGKAIRGGISVCLPQRPGYARNRLWSLDSFPWPLPPINNQSTVDLKMECADVCFKTQPHRFDLRLRISLSADKLTLIPRVFNNDCDAFSFTFGLCNYLSVSDISEVSVEGLETLEYIDNLAQGKRYTEQANAITFDGEIERVYMSTPTTIAVKDHEKKKTIILGKEGMPDTVVWNPWAREAKALPDVGDEDYKTMLCVGSASIHVLL